jgi:hypothetical protein
MSGCLVAAGSLLQQQTSFPVQQLQPQFLAVAANKGDTATRREKMSLDFTPEQLDRFVAGERSKIALPCVSRRGFRA